MQDSRPTPSTHSHKKPLVFSSPNPSTSTILTDPFNPDLPHDNPTQSASPSAAVSIASARSSSVLDPFSYPFNLDPPNSSPVQSTSPLVSVSMDITHSSSVLNQVTNEHEHVDSQFSSQSASTASVADT